MEKRESIMRVLSEGRELAKELKRKLRPTTDSRKDILVQNILSSYENAIKLFELPNLVSPSSEMNCENKKQSVKLSEKVKVRSEAGFEGQGEDGYSWRKYGQKSILGSNHPRAYYRCTHRNTQGCLARKQVQRTDDDPSVFEVVYKGKHSCMQERPKQTKENPSNVLNNDNQECLDTTITTNPRPKPENQQVDDHFPSFRFPSTPIEPQNIRKHFLSETSNFMGTNYSPWFCSQATPESYFSTSQFPVNDFGNGFGEIISNPTRDLDFSVDQIDFSSQVLDAMEYM